MHDLNDDSTLKAALSAFAIDGEFLGAEVLRRGHIHHTWVSTYAGPHGTRRYVHQRLNAGVFPDLPLLMRNVERVCAHLRRRYDMGATESLRPLELVPTKTGTLWLDLPDAAWRTYDFVENTVTLERPDNERRARAAAYAFGLFQRLLAEMPVGSLDETIPGFFDGAARLAAFEKAARDDVASRRHGCASEIAFVRDHAAGIRSIDRSIRNGDFPRRFVHGDTKLNNLLFDSRTGDPVCVVDLDTCMPAWSLYDFGDLVRFTAAKSAEDELDLAKAGVDRLVYAAIEEGFFDGCGDILNMHEHELMQRAAEVVTLIVGVRFLTDHLNGDVYFATGRPNHNLDRARVQFRQVESMENW